MDVCFMLYVNGITSPCPGIPACLAVRMFRMIFGDPPCRRSLKRIDQRFGGSLGMLDAAIIGKAAAQLHHDSSEWSDWGTFDETFQHLKQLWHVLVKYGHSYPYTPNR